MVLPFEWLMEKQCVVHGPYAELPNLNKLKSEKDVIWSRHRPLKCQKITSRVQNCTILTEHNGLAAYPVGDRQVLVIPGS